MRECKDLAALVCDASDRLRGLWRKCDNGLQLMKMVEEHIEKTLRAGKLDLEFDDHHHQVKQLRGQWWHPDTRSHALSMLVVFNRITEHWATFSNMARKLGMV